jgi:hypothetical protein
MLLYTQHSFHSFSLNILSIIAYHQRVITFLKECWVFSLCYVYTACRLWFWVLELRLKIYKLKKHMMRCAVVSYACGYLSICVLVTCPVTHLVEHGNNFNFLLDTVFVIIMAISMMAVQMKPVHGNSSKHGQLHVITWLRAWCTSSRPWVVKWKCKFDSVWQILTGTIFNSLCTFIMLSNGLCLNSPHSI